MVQGFLIVVIAACIYSFACYFYSKKFIFRQYDKKGYTYYDAEDTFNFVKYKLDPRDFEVFICELFRELGYEAQVTQASQDWGRDVVVDNGRIIVECKQYHKTLVGRDICFKLYGAMEYHGAEKCIIVNTGFYNKPAYMVEEKLSERLEFWDKGKLMEIFHELGKERVENVINRTLEQQSIIVRYNKEDDEQRENSDEMNDIGGFVED